jgi:ligand-binding sensor domain-containing protein
MKNRYTNNSGILIFLTVLIFQVSGQQIVFNKLLPEDAEYFDAVGNIKQDKNGRMWFATKSGLYCYDGNQMTSYRNNPSDPYSLSSNILIPVWADNNGIVWTGSLGGGLNRLDTETGVFTHFRHNPDEPASLSSDTVSVILRDKSGILWIGTHGGLDKFDPETNSFVHYRNNANDSASLSNNQVIVIYEDNHETLWIGTGSAYPSNGGGPEDGGLNRMDKSNGTFTRFRHDPNNNKSLITNKISAIFEDNRGTFWVGTSKNGLHKMDKQKGTFEQIFSDPKHPENYTGPLVSRVGLPFDCITFITQDAVGTIWFGTVASGFYSFDPTTEKIERFDGPHNSASGFTDYRARSGFTSRDGVLWIGTQGGNIYYMDPSVRKIKHTSVNGSPVGSFYEEPNGDFWIGSYNELFKTNRNGELTKQYVTDDLLKDVPYDLGFFVNGDSLENIWIGTALGLYLWDKKNDKLIAYKHDPKNVNSISNSFIIATYEDSKSSFWVGTAYGLNLIDRKTGLFTRFYPFPENKNLSGPNIVTSILEDKSGKLWISNWSGGGVNLFNPESRKFKNYLKGRWFVNLYQDSDNVLWAVGTTGLFSFDPEKDDFDFFTPKGYFHGILEVRSIIEDKQKNLWLTTRNEILRINPERDEINVFGQNFGVGQSDFIQKSAYIKKNGEIYFGNLTGYFSFYPGEFIQSLRTPEIVFTSLSLSDKKLITGDGGPLTEDLNDQKEIKFRYNQNVFSFDIAIIDYANPKQNRLSYFLENYDNSWRNVNLERRAYYFNVPPGKYTFRVKGVNSYGGIAEKKLDITILPPWYRTWLAYAIYAILFFGAAFLMYRIQKTRLLRKEKRKIAYGNWNMHMKLKRHIITSK